MGKMKEFALEQLRRKAEIQWLEAEKNHEISEKQAELDALKEGMPKTLEECHENIILLLEQNRILNKKVMKMSSRKELLKNQCIGFGLGILASIIASVLIG